MRTHERKIIQNTREKEERIEIDYKTLNLSKFEHPLDAFKFPRFHTKTTQKEDAKKKKNEERLLPRSSLR